MKRFLLLVSKYCFVIKLIYSISIYCIQHSFFNQTAQRHLRRVFVCHLSVKYTGKNLLLEFIPRKSLFKPLLVGKHWWNNLFIKWVTGILQSMSSYLKRPLCPHAIHINQQNEPVIYSSISPSTKAASLCPVAQDRASRRGTVVGFVPISCLTFPRPAPVPWHACSVGTQPSRPSSLGSSFCPYSSTAIHSSIHTPSRWLLVSPSDPEQGLSLGDSSLLCPPLPHASNSPDPPQVPPPGTGHWEGQGSLRTLFPFLFLILSLPECPAASSHLPCFWPQVFTNVPSFLAAPKTDS